MKYFNYFCCLLWACLVPMSCSSTMVEELEDTTNMIQLDKNMKVLVLGNSYSVDGTAYFDHLVKSANLNVFQLCLYNGVINGGGIQEWLDAYLSKKFVSFNRVVGKINMMSDGILCEILQQDWDVVVIMQASDKSYSWANFEGKIENLIKIIQNECTNKQVRLMYAIPWGHTIASTPRELEGNIICARKLKENFGISMIPVGIAIQNARNTSLCNDAYMTRDNWHLCFGAGRYIAACTWYEALLADVSHVSIVGNPAIPSLSGNEWNNDTTIPVDESNRLLCQKCAFYAVRDTFRVTNGIR